MWRQSPPAKPADRGIVRPGSNLPPVSRRRDPGTLTVRECLSLPALERAEVVAGAEGLDDRLVRWMAVTEHPVDHFVAHGEFVLTTGLGCDAETFEGMVADVADAGAAALLVGVGEGAPMPAIPKSVRRLADHRALPLIELPWAVRFADVLRTLTDRLLATRYAATFDASSHLPSDFTTALLHRDGLRSIAEALEGLIGRPVLVLDPELAVTAHGPLAAARLGDGLVEQPVAARGLEAARLAAIRDALADGDVHAFEAVEEARLPAGLAVAAAAQGSTLGYVLGCDPDTGPGGGLIVERQALAHAAVAVAIETLRRRSVAEAEANARGDFLWELAARALVNPAEIATKAVLLGYASHQAYRVALAEAEADEDGGNTLDELTRRLRRHGAAAGVQCTRRGTRLLVLVPVGAPASLEPRALVSRVAEAADTSCSWGIADGAFPLQELADGVERAERALRVGRALEGPGGVADAEALGPFLLLHAIADDETARGSAAAVIAPIVEYDRDTSRGLLETLEVFLAENGNTSSAARRLFLNRHSLMYRLRKIEALTGRSLDRHDDRFLLELSLRLRRLAPG